MGGITETTVSFETTSLPVEAITFSSVSKEAAPVATEESKELLSSAVSDAASLLSVTKSQPSSILTDFGMLLNAKNVTILNLT